MFNGHKHLSHKKQQQKTDYFLKKYIFDRKKSKVFRSDSEQDPDPDPEPDPLFHETDSRIQIWIHIKMKRIRNTDKK